MNNSLPSLDRANHIKPLIERYFLDNIYRGFVRHFELDYFKISDNSRYIVHIMPKLFSSSLGLIEKVDKEWEKGLSELGKRNNMALLIHPNCYSKGLVVE